MSLWLPDLSLQLLWAQELFCSGLFGSSADAPDRNDDSLAPTPSCESAPAQNAWSARALALAMAAHPRCGADVCPAVRAVATSHDLMLAIFRQVSIVVPDDAPTLVAALRMAVPWQRILLRRGEHLVSANTAVDPGSSQLRITTPVSLAGESGDGGTVLRGTLVLDGGCAGGSLEQLRIDDGGDCCLRCEGGAWELQRVRLRCSHGSALHVAGSARVTLRECVLGGEAVDERGATLQLSAYGSVQEYGLHKRACYALVARDSATVVARRCALRQCSEAAVLLAHVAQARLHACHLSDCTAAVMAGQGLGRMLELQHCTVEASVRRLWADHDRPMATTWDETNRRVEPPPDSDTMDQCDVVPSEQPRGADDDSDTDSLEDDTEFANMENLMEELDDIALSAARR